MNGTIIIAGLAAAFRTLGHFALGRKNYLQPMLKSAIIEQSP